MLLILIIIFIALMGFQVNRVQRIAQAIAHAEGFFADGNPLPRRANNPGDLKLGNQGHGEIAGKTIFPSVAAGWAALYKEISLILTGMSRYYKADMTIQQVADIWTGGDASSSWAETVAEQLGTTVDTPIKDV